MARGKSSAPAYTLIDPSELPEDVRQDIIEDAHAGGKNYGVVVVEESVNGGARAALYGVYKDVEDPANPGKLLNDSTTRWEAAKKDLDISASEVDDGEVSGMGTIDPRREAALRQQAQQNANAEAERIRTAEDAEVAAVDSSQQHTANIVDDTLSSEATNVVDARTGEVEAEEETSKAKTKNKAPR